MKKLLLIITLLTLAACQNASKKYDVALNNYMYQDEAVIFAKYGTPTNIQYINENTKIISFKQQTYAPQDLFSTSVKVKANGMQIDTITPMIAYNAMQVTHALVDPNTRQEMLYDTCLTNFTISNGTVVDYGFTGDDCGKLK